MANSDKNLIITPNIGSTTDDPKIVFSGADSSTTAQDITLRVYPTSNGTLSVEGSAGQLFSITNNLTGTLFSVNDISGIPSIEVTDDGTVSLAEYSGNVGIGTASPTEKLEVNGTIKATSFSGDGSNLTGISGASNVTVSTNSVTANGLVSSFTLDFTPANEESLIVSLDGVLQEPTSAYTVSGNVITFASAPANTVRVVATSMYTNVATYAITVEAGVQTTAENAYAHANGAFDKANTALVSGNIGSTVQAYDADLTTLGGLAKTDGNFIVGNGSTWVVENGATARTSLGLGSLATLSSVGASQITDNSVGAAELNVSGNGTAGQVLQSDGDGTMTWADASGGITTGKAIAMAIVFG